MNAMKNNPEQRNLLPEDIDNMIGLLNSLRTEIRRCEDQYYESRKGNVEFDMNYWYERFLIPTYLCVDIITMSNHLLRELFNPGEEYQRNFSGTEHIFTVKPTSSEAFINSAGYLRSLLIPFVLLYIHTVKNPDNHTRSDNLVGDISGLVNNVISIRGENKERMIRAAIDKGGEYFSS